MSVVTDLSPQAGGGGRGAALKKTASRHHSWTIVVGMAIVGTLLALLAYIPPFTLAQRQAIAAGRVPDGEL